MNGIGTESSSIKVALLEVTGDLVESVAIEQVVDFVASVEELGDGGVDVRLGIECVTGRGEMDGVLEGHARSGVGSDVIDVGVSSVPVLLSKNVVSSSIGEVGDLVRSADRVPADGRGLGIQFDGRTDENLASSLVRCVTASVIVQSARVRGAGGERRG